LGATEAVVRAKQVLVGRALVAIAAAGSTASLIVVYTSLRAVLSSGGFCAGGGAYAIAHQCDRSDTVLLLSGALGMLTCGSLLVAATAWLRGPVMRVSLSLWVALFATLGWNLIDLGADRRPMMGAGTGLIVAGAALWLMTLIGLTPLVRVSSSRVATGGTPRGGQLGVSPPAGATPRGGQLRGLTPGPGDAVS
jgi:hypothetical protein